MRQDAQRGWSWFVAILMVLMLGEGAAVAQAANVVQILTPSNGATVSGSVNVSVKPSRKVALIKLYIDGNYWTSSPPYSFTWNSTMVLNGSHKISAYAYNPKEHCWARAP